MRRIVAITIPASCFSLSFICIPQRIYRFSTTRNLPTRAAPTDEFSSLLLSSLRFAANIRHCHLAYSFPSRQQGPLRFVRHLATVAARQLSLAALAGSEPS